MRGSEIYWLMWQGIFRRIGYIIRFVKAFVYNGLVMAIYKYQVELIKNPNRSFIYRVYRLCSAIVVGVAHAVKDIKLILQVCFYPKNVFGWDGLDLLLMDKMTLESMPWDSKYVSGLPDAVADILKKIYCYRVKTRMDSLDFLGYVESYGHPGFIDKHLELGLLLEAAYTARNGTPRPGSSIKNL